MACIVISLIHATSATINFSAVFSDGIVLQRATSAHPETQAAVYGSGATGQVTVTVSSVLDADSVVVTASASDGSWKALLPPKPAGGQYTVTATDAAGSKSTILRVTFGDVWFCSGQVSISLPS